MCHRFININANKTLIVPNRFINIKCVKHQTDSYIWMWMLTTYRAFRHWLRLLNFYTLGSEWRILDTNSSTGFLLVSCFVKYHSKSVPSTRIVNIPITKFGKLGCISLLLYDKTITRYLATPQNCIQLHSFIGRGLHEGMNDLATWSTLTLAINPWVLFTFIPS